MKRMSRAQAKRILGASIKSHCKVIARRLAQISSLYRFAMWPIMMRDLFRERAEDIDTAIYFERKRRQRKLKTPKR